MRLKNWLVIGLASTRFLEALFTRSWMMWWLPRFLEQPLKKQGVMPRVFSVCMRRTAAEPEIEAEAEASIPRAKAGLTPEAKGRIWLICTARESKA